MKTEVNPAYRDAPYEMCFQFADKKPRQIDPWPHRFNTPWPDDISGDTLWEWVQKNSIPKFITVE